MMMFRRLYWIAEEVDKNNCSKITGVYTSIQHLIHKGLHWSGDRSAHRRFRLTLEKPDSFDSPLGVWESPSFDGLEQALDTYVTSGELGREEVMLLIDALHDFVPDHAKAS